MESEQEFNEQISLYNNEKNIIEELQKRLDVESLYKTKDHVDIILLNDAIGEHASKLDMYKKSTKQLSASILKLYDKRMFDLEQSISNLTNHTSYLKPKFIEELNDIKSGRLIYLLTENDIDQSCEFLFFISDHSEKFLRSKLYSLRILPNTKVIMVGFVLAIFKIIVLTIISILTIWFLLKYFI
jgi:hypothetical protein